MKKYFQFIAICMLCLLLAGCSNTSELQQLYNQKGKLMDTQKQTIQEYNKLYQKWLQLDAQIKELDKQIEKLKVKPLGYLGRKLLACTDCPDEILYDYITGAIAPLINTGDNTGDRQNNLITDRDKLLMSRVCKYGKINDKISPLCNNRDMYMSGKKIFSDRNVPRDIAIWVMYAESHIWINYAGSCDESWNNRGGIKYRILDDGSRERDQPIPNWNWCRLYKFKSLDDYFISKANTFTKYSWCFNKDKPITCMAYNYVGNPKVAEQSRIYRVSLIAE